MNRNIPAPLTIEETPEKDKPVIIKAVAYKAATDEAEAQTGEYILSPIKPL